ncbi:hypothetical protein [Pseudomonas leptonychotis]|uniref:hypothetical protein n=1 Tax=Pseudomonas leptonychotis TaxID=2448482 RepID=UPI0038664581
MSNATLIHRTVVNALGHVVRVVVCSGQRWVVARDIAISLLLRPGAITARIRMHSEVFAGHYCKARIEGHPVESLLLSEEGGRLFIEGMKSKPEPEGLESQLIAWLDAGALRSEPSDAAITRELHSLYPIADDDVDYREPLPEKVDIISPPRSALGLRLVPRGPDPMQQLLEREKAYCRDLVKTLLRYCESEGVNTLTGLIDGQIDHVLETRFCPGLNAARYELYRKYWLQGGGV